MKYTDHLVQLSSFKRRDKLVQHYVRVNSSMKNSKLSKIISDMIAENKVLLSEINKRVVGNFYEGEKIIAVTYNGSDFILKTVDGENHWQFYTVTEKNLIL